MNLEEEYRISEIPFREATGPTPISALSLKSWRYIVEINSACNLKCCLCIAGNREGYEFHKGFMDVELLGAICDKAKTENPHATFAVYGNSEPFLHPKLPECCQTIKDRGFNLLLSSNFNIVRRLDEVLAIPIDEFQVSVSGFTQEVYGKHHIGGDVETVKKNLVLLKEKKPKVHVIVNYHMYRDNMHEVGPMKEFVESLGFQFMNSWARAISIENTVACLRHEEEVSCGSVPPYVVIDGVNLNEMLPKFKEEYKEALKLLSFNPALAREKYARFPVAKVCSVTDAFCYIRYNGDVQLCCWTDDMRFSIGKFLETTQAQMTERRRFHPICHECLKYRLNLYFQIIDPQIYNL